VIHMTMVHGNGDVIEEDFGTLADAHARAVTIEDFGTLADAHARAVTIEDERHGAGGDLRSRFEFEHTDAGRGFQQFGTNYHYVMFEEKP
jgi:hypothetical protein